MKTRLAIALVLAGASLGGLAWSQDAPATSPATRPGSAGELSAALKRVVQENLQAMAREDADRVMATVHPNSPVFQETRRLTAALFQQYDLKYELVSYGFVGTDGEYAVARVKQTTAKMAGPAFQDNTVDMMHIFRKDGAAWKVWQSAILQVEYVRPPGAVQ